MEEDQEVRKSIVRISFDWEPEDEDKRFMVIPGIILSINDDDKSAVIAANSIFFGLKRKFVVNFPSATGYEQGQKFNVRKRNRSTKGVLAAYESAEGFYIFTANPKENGYIKAVRFETKPVKDGDPVNAFVFPREGFITPTGYCSGSVGAAGHRVFTHDCDMHEYGYLGSPLFNSSGDLVGITYLDHGTCQTWTVKRLQVILRKWKSTIVFVHNGNEGNGESAGAEAQVENQVVEAQVEE